MHIFYCANGKFGEVAGVFFTPDAGLGGTGRCTCVFGALSISSTGEQRASDVGVGCKPDTIHASGGA